MRIVPSAKVQALLDKRLKKDKRLLPQVRRLASRVLKTKSVEAAVEGMRLASGFVPDAGPALVVLTIKGFVLVFDKRQHEVRRMIESLKVRESPEKVAVKMVLLRLMKLMRTVRVENDVLRSENPDPRRPPLPLYSLPSDAESTVDLLRYLDEISGRTSVFTWDILDVRSVLDRPEVTNAVVEEALRRLLVKDVLES